MTMSYNPDIRDARMMAYVDALDADVSPGYRRIYGGTRPAAGAAITTEPLLGEIVFNSPPFTLTADGVITVDADPALRDDEADDDGTATWFRDFDGDDNWIADGDCGDSEDPDADMVFGNTTINEGQPIVITGGAREEGNP